ncbi:MAG: glycosyltransferase family 4 protein [Nitrospinae bacterium]|nr:glycosyltransferase family 4 protein [Nitrospinota bacterium]
MSGEFSILKVCLTIFSSPWSRFKGGGQIAVHQLACALQRQGCEVHVIYSKEPDEKIEPDVPYKIHWTRRFNFATINLDIFSFAWSLNRLARREGFDIVHGNAEESFFSSWICRRHNAIAFFTSHAPYVPTTGIFRALCRPISFLKTVNPYLLRSAARRATKIITFSQFSRNLVLAGLGPCWQDRIAVIPGGIDPSWLDVERMPSEKPELVFWGRMEDEKGIPELLTAMKIVVKKIPDVKLTLVGEGNRLEEYKQRVRKLGLIPRMIVPGWQSMEAIQKLAVTASAAVFPSRIESFGMSVAEAQGAGVPVIATNAGALPEIVEHGVTGTLVSPRDPEALADAICAVLENKEKFQRMAEQGRKTARQKFSWDSAAEQLTGLYRRELAALGKSFPAGE